MGRDMRYLEKFGKFVIVALASLLLAFKCYADGMPDDKAFLNNW